MKKLIASILVSVMAVSYSGIVFADDAEPQVVFNDTSFSAKIVDGSTYILARDFEVLGYKVDWNGEEKTVTFSKDDFVLKLNVANNVYEGKYNDTLKNTVKVIDGKTLLPLREFLELMGYNIDWNNDTKTAVISQANENSSIKSTDETITEMATTEIVTEVATNEDVTEAVTEATTIEANTVQSEEDHKKAVQSIFDGVLKNKEKGGISSDKLKDEIKD